MATQHDDNAPLSAAGKRLEASLENTKFACSDYMDNSCKKTEADFSVASVVHVSALQSAGLKKQAGPMSKVDRIDFRKAKTTSVKQRIVEFLARSLYRMTVKQLKRWTVAAAVSSAGVLYALYEIKTAEWSTPLTPTVMELPMSCVSTPTVTQFPTTSCWTNTTTIRSTHSSTMTGKKSSPTDPTSSKAFGLFSFYLGS